MTFGSLMDPEIQECPWSFHKSLREEAPVYVDPMGGFYVISRYDDVKEAFRNWSGFSSKEGFPRYSSEATERIYATGYGDFVDTLTSNDPPSHDRYRNLVNKVFTADHVNKMEGYIQQIVDMLIDGLLDQSSVDIHNEFSMKLPVTVIADQLGVPRDKIGQLKEWTDVAVASSVGLMASDEEHIVFAEKQVEFQHYFVERLEERRKNPKDDLLTDLVQARTEEEKPLTTPELLSVIRTLLVGGNETTTNTLSAGIVQLIKNPAVAEQLRENPDLYPSLVEEVLRIDAAVQGLFRMAMEDMNIGGVDIPKGSICHLRIGSANYDETVYECPEQLRLDRRSKRHISFGAGIHMCVGAMLARKEITLGLRAVNERLPNLRLDVSEEELEHVPNVALRGFTSLPVSFG